MNANKIRKTDYEITMKFIYLCGYKIKKDDCIPVDASLTYAYNKTTDDITFMFNNYQFVICISFWFWLIKQFLCFLNI